MKSVAEEKRNLNMTCEMQRTCFLIRKKKFLCKHRTLSWIIQKFLLLVFWEFAAVFFPPPKRIFQLRNCFFLKTRYFFLVSRFMSKPQTYYLKRAYPKNCRKIYASLSGKRNKFLLHICIWSRDSSLSFECFSISLTIFSSSFS